MTISINATLLVLSIQQTQKKNMSINTYNTAQKFINTYMYDLSKLIILTCTLFIIIRSRNNFMPNLFVYCKHLIQVIQFTLITNIIFLCFSFNKWFWCYHILSICRLIHIIIIISILSSCQAVIVHRLHY